MEKQFESWMIQKNQKLYQYLQKTKNGLVPIKMFLGMKFLFTNGWNQEDVKLACSSSQKLRIYGNKIGLSQVNTNQPVKMS